MRSGCLDSRRRHVSLLKAWKSREGLLITPFIPEPKLGPLVKGPLESRPVTMGQELSPEYQGKLQYVVQTFLDVLLTHLGWTMAMSHHIATIPGQKVHEDHWPLPRKMWDAVWKDLETMLNLGVVEEMQSEWRSPIVLVSKPDGAI